MNKKILGPLSVLLLCTGCETVNEGLIGEEREELAPFAEAIIELIGGTAIEFRPSELVYLRKYYEENAEVLQELSMQLARVDEFRDDMVQHSVELVRISEGYPTDAEQCAELASLVEGREDTGVFYNSGVSDAEYRALAAELRSMDNFLQCLRKAQPFVARAGGALEDLIGSIEDADLPRARTLIDSSIEREFATVIAQLEIIYERRDRLFGGLQKIHAYRNGDSSALQDFGAASGVTNPSYLLSASPSDEQLERTKDHIIEQLRKEQEIFDLLAVDRGDYIAAHAELDAEEQEIIKGLEMARVQAVLWVRAHQGLADGVRNPGKWVRSLMRVALTYRAVR